jgi:DNA-binding NarL/FixJ family response regulator
MVPDVVLQDIELGSGPDGITTGHIIQEAHSNVGVIILSGHKKREYINLVVQEGRSSWSYLLKQSVNDVVSLGRAIRGAASGLVVIDPAIVNGLKPIRGSIIAGLSPRQQEVLALMAQGYSNSAIAEKLVISIKSVENYVNVIYQELHLSANGPLHPRVQAVLEYIKDCS